MHEGQPFSAYPTWAGEHRYDRWRRADRCRRRCPFRFSHRSGHQLTTTPVKGSPVVFKLMGQSGADLIPDTVQTDADGRARSKWVLGHAAGDQSVQAEVKLTPTHAAFPRHRPRRPGRKHHCRKGRSADRPGRDRAGRFTRRESHRPVRESRLGILRRLERERRRSVSAATVITGANGRRRSSECWATTRVPKAPRPMRRA